MCFFIEYVTKWNLNSNSVNFFSLQIIYNQWIKSDGADFLRTVVKQITKFLFSFPSNELGNIQHEAPNNNFAKPLAWGSQQPQPLLVVLRRGITGKSPWKSAAPQQTESKHSFAFGLHDFSTPSQGPSPLQGKGCNRSLSGRSDIKVSATHQRVAGRFLTQQSCDCWCSLRSPKCEKPSSFGSCRDCLCGLRPRLL